jgi:hypothetical protein
MATPLVAGVAALVWCFFPSCSNEQIRAAINLTAKDKGATAAILPLYLLSFFLDSSAKMTKMVSHLLHK